jgi:hypothetical protein
MLTSFQLTDEPLAFRFLLLYGVVLLPLALAFFVIHCGFLLALGFPFVRVFGGFLLFFVHCVVCPSVSCIYSAHRLRWHLRGRRKALVPCEHRLQRQCLYHG